jgi:hypothetical protein
VTQSQASLLQLEMAQILQHDIGHRHAQSRGEILFCHGLLLNRVSQEAGQAGRQINGIARFVKLNCHSFAVGHLAKIFYIRAHDGNAVGAGQMRHSAAAGGGRVRHDGDGGTLKKIRQAIFVHISGEFNIWIRLVLLLHRLDIACSLRMVASAHDQRRIGHGLREQVEGLNHQLEPLVGSPFAKSENAMLRISAPGKIGILRLSDEDAVRAEVDIVATVSFMEDLAIAGHEHGNRISEQQHFGGNGAAQTVGALVPHAGVFQIHGIHEMVQGHVGIAATKTGKKRREKSGEGNQGITPEGAEQQIEPNHVWLQLEQGAENMQ